MGIGQLRLYLRHRVVVPSAGAPLWNPDASLWSEAAGQFDDVPNCLSWALDCPGAGAHLPGHRAARQGAEPCLDYQSASDLEDLLEEEGLLRVGATLPPTPGWLVALYMSGRAYHFVRLDQGGWSHKPGHFSPEQLHRLPLTIKLRGERQRLRFRSFWWRPASLRC